MKFKLISLVALSSALLFSGCHNLQPCKDTKDTQKDSNTSKQKIENLPVLIEQYTENPLKYCDFYTDEEYSISIEDEAKKDIQVVEVEVEEVPKEVQIINYSNDPGYSSFPVLVRKKDK